MQPILLSTLNAKYIHASFGLRYLAANMGELAQRTRIAEFDINQRPLEIVERILAHGPVIIGLGVYVWNARQTLEVVRLLKQIVPAISIVLGGPEVSHETEQQEICALADVIITGEADLKFAGVCGMLLSGNRPGVDRDASRAIKQRIIAAEPPDLASLHFPYDFYGEEDIAHRIIYVEASRGCPFRCEFCLSSLDETVRNFPLESFLCEMERLLQRGARHLKFVDRTFNLNLETSLAILDFFWKRYQPGLFLHFEIVPDRLPEALREALAKFPPGALQLEAGVQTFNPEVAKRIQRRQNYERLEENLGWLRENTFTHIHADLIAGLPGETMESFAAGFDRLLALHPQEIQAGILKRLRGAPIARHTEEWGMIYAPDAPYELLCNSVLDFPSMQRIRRFAKYWDHVANSGNFAQTVRQLWSKPGTAKDQSVLKDAWETSSPFHAFMAFTDWAYNILNRTDSISISSWAELLLRYLTEIVGMEPKLIKESLLNDFDRTGRKQIPPFLRCEPDAHTKYAPVSSASAAPKRQRKHIK